MAAFDQGKSLVVRKLIGALTMRAPNFFLKNFQTFYPMLFILDT